MSDAQDKVTFLIILGAIPFIVAALLAWNARDDWFVATTYAVFLFIFLAIVYLVWRYKIAK